MSLDTIFQHFRILSNESPYSYKKSKPKQRYSTKKFPISRNGIVDLMDLSKKQHNVHQTFEIDVTDLRISQKKYKEKVISFYNKYNNYNSRL